MHSETRALTGDSPGSGRQLVAHHYGTPGQAPKVYLQAGLHADEMPGVLILQHLMDLLDQANVRGHIVIVPAANPIGLAQWAFQRPLGRLEAETTHNFNRGYPDLAALAGDMLEPRLAADAGANLRIIRQAFAEALDQVDTRTDMQELRIALMRWSHDADYVLDLHCDHRAVLHLYASPARPDDTTLLCKSTGAELALIQEVSGGHAFDEAHTAPWAALHRRFDGRFPIPPGCFSSTLEYRGQFDVDDATAGADAANLMTFLAAIGAVTGWPATPSHPDAPHYPLGGAEEFHAPQGGVVAWNAAPGAMVSAGDVLARVTDPMTRARLPVTAPCDGMMFRRELWPSCLRGQSLGHVAGPEARREGHLLSD
jgi:uncharacterized protein